MRMGPKGRLNDEELMFSNCGAGEDSWESLGQQGDQTSQSERKSMQNIHQKNWCWSWSSSSLATWYEEPTHWKRGQEEKGVIEDEIVGWHHWLNGHEFEQTLGKSGGQDLACLSPWGHKESDMSLGLNNNNNNKKQCSIPNIYLSTNNEILQRYKDSKGIALIYYFLKWPWNCDNY